MKLQKETKQFVRTIAVGTVILSVLMVAVFLLLGRFDWTVLVGAVWGTCFAVLNNLLMALGVQKAAALSARELRSQPKEEKAAQATDADEDDEKEKEIPDIGKPARASMQTSYTLRMLMMVVACVLAYVIPFIHSVAGILPLLFPQLVIVIENLRQKKA